MAHMTARRLLRSVPVGLLLLLVADCASGRSGESTLTPMPSQEHRCPCNPRASSTQAQPARFEAVVSDQEDYAGRRVRLRGFLFNEKENQGLYRFEADAEHPRFDGTRVAGCNIEAPIRPMRALWWSGEEIPPECSRIAVTIEGTVDPCDSGHMDAFSAGLRDAVVVACGP
jgi:hypothetical protein